MKCEKCNDPIAPYCISVTEDSYIQELKEKYKAKEESYEQEIANLHLTIQKLEYKRTFEGVISRIFSYVQEHFFEHFLSLFLSCFIISLFFVIVVGFKTAWIPGKIQYCYIEHTDSQFYLKAHYDYAFDNVITHSDDPDKLKKIAKEYNCELKIR